MNISDFQEEWLKNNSNEKGVLIWVNDIQKFVTAKFGTGVNLLDEDMTAGYDDYIYIEILEYGIPDELKEIDGAQLLFNTAEKDYYTNLKSFCLDALEMVSLDESDYTILMII